MSLFFDSLECRQMLSTTTFRDLTLAQGQRTGQAFAISGSKFNLIDNNAAQIVGSAKVSKTGTLFITGTSADDTYNITVKNGKLTSVPLVAFQREDSSADSNLVRVASYSTFSRKIKRIIIVGLGGDDKITVTADVAVSVRGSAGNDRITVTAPTREIVGGSGKDVIHEREVFSIVPVDTEKHDFTLTPVGTPYGG